MEDEDTYFGRVAYEAYCESTGGKSAISGQEASRGGIARQRVNLDGLANRAEQLGADAHVAHDAGHHQLVDGAGAVRAQAPVTEAEGADHVPELGDRARVTVAHRPPVAAPGDIATVQVLLAPQQGDDPLLVLG